MSNIFYSGFHIYIVNASNPYGGRFYESNEILIYELKKSFLEWDVVGQVRFPEHQCVQILFKYAQINKIIKNETICCCLNELNRDDDHFGWFYLEDGYLYAKVVLLPDNENYDIRNVINIINYYLNYTDYLYNLFKNIEMDVIRDKEKYATTRSAKHSDFDRDTENVREEEFYEDYEDSSGRWSAEELAEYYGYQHDDDYSAGQFLDDL